MAEDLIQRGSGKWAVYYTSIQSSIITFSYSLALGNFIEFVWLSVQTFQALILITRSGDFCINILDVN